jgi:hypothetical protein
MSQRKASKEVSLTKAELREMLGEAVHTAFRKGSGHPDAHAVWLAIRNMNNKAFSDCMDWVVWSLFYAKEEEAKRARQHP